MTSTCFSLIEDSTLLLGLFTLIFGMNFEAMFCLNILLLLSVLSESHPASEMNCQAAWPKPSSYGISFSIFSITDEICHS